MSSGSCTHGINGYFSRSSGNIDPVILIYDPMGDTFL